MNGKKRSAGTQLASIAACRSRSFSGKTRKMYFALPVSIQFFFNCGRVVLSNSAQCGQVSEPYSMIVIGASALPSTWSSAVGVGPDAGAAAVAGTPERDAASVRAAKVNQI